MPPWITSLSVTEIDAEVKRWGNSLGIRVPAALAQAQGIRPGDRVHVSIEKFRPPNPAFFGMGRRRGRTPTAAETRRSLRESRAREAAAWERKMRDFDRAPRRR